MHCSYIIHSNYCKKTPWIVINIGQIVFSVFFPRSSSAHNSLILSCSSRPWVSSPEPRGGYALCSFETPISATIRRPEGHSQSLMWEQRRSGSGGPHSTNSLLHSGTSGKKDLTQFSLKLVFRKKADSFRGHCFFLAASSGYIMCNWIIFAHFIFYGKEIV